MRMENELLRHVQELTRYTNDPRITDAIGEVHAMRLAAPLNAANLAVSACNEAEAVTKCKVQEIVEMT